MAIFPAVESYKLITKAAPNGKAKANEYRVIALMTIALDSIFSAGVTNPKTRKARGKMYMKILTAIGQSSSNTLSAQRLFNKLNKRSDKEPNPK